MKNQSKVFGNIVLIIVLNFLVKPFWVFGIDTMVQNQVGNVDYGIYGKYLSLSFVFSILMDMGMTNYNQRNIAADQSALQREYHSLWKTKWWLVLFYVIFMHILFILLSHPWREYPIFVAVLSMQVFTSLALFIRSAVSGLHLYRWDSFLSMFDKVFALLVCATILYIFQNSHCSKSGCY